MGERNPVGFTLYLVDERSWQLPTTFADKISRVFLKLMTMWSGDALDLDGYLTRIGFTESTAPTEATLRGLHRAHTTSLPFENLEIILGRPIPLDLPSLQDKVIHARRGGYCFEHATLFAAALEQLGFKFSALSGRVSLGADTPRPATHALLVVELDDERKFLCDVGFGRGPLEPLELIDGVEVNQDGWKLRLSVEAFGSDADVFRPPLWTLWQVGDDGEWIDRHRFTLNPQYPIDYAVGNHFVSTSPRSPFTMRPFIQRFTGDIHHTLDGLTVTTAEPGGPGHTRDVEPAAVPELLADTFDIELSSDDATALVATLGA